MTGKEAWENFASVAMKRPVTFEPSVSPLICARPMLGPQSDPYRSWSDGNPGDCKRHTSDAARAGCPGADPYCTPATCSTSNIIRSVSDFGDTQSARKRTGWFYSTDLTHAGCCNSATCRISSPALWPNSWSRSERNPGGIYAATVRPALSHQVDSDASSPVWNEK